MESCCDHWKGTFDLFIHVLSTRLLFGTALRERDGCVCERERERRERERRERGLKFDY